MPEFYRQLKFQCKLVLVFLLIVFVFSLVGAFSLIVLAGSGIEWLSPWQELTAWRFLNALMVLSGLAFVLGIWFILRRRPSTTQLSRQVEQRHPELKQSLTTATEVLERGGPRNPIEEALIRQVEKDTEEIPFRRSTLPRRFHPVAALAIVIASVLLSDFAAQTRLFQKAQFYQGDRLRGENTGLIIEPGDADVPRGSDLVITAQIERWERDPQIFLKEDGAAVAYPMMLDEDGNGRFTLFDLQESMTYRVKTSSLQSPEYTIDVYEPPTWQSLEIAIVPPAYSREEPLAYGKLLDLFALEGSTITVRVETAPAIGTVMRLGEEELVVMPEASFIAEESTDYQLRLANAEGREWVSESFNLEVRPDEPPVAEVVDPGQDTQSNLEGIVPLELYAADDYGIAEVVLHVSVSGLPRRPVSIYKHSADEPLLERDFLSQLEIPRLGVEHGDVLTYYFTVTDNKEPDPNVVQTGIFFVEVVKEVDPMSPEDTGQGEGEGEEQEVNLRAIIVEMKRVIRETHRGSVLSGQRREQAMQQLGADVNSVEIEVQKLLSEIGGILMQVEGGAFYLIMQNAIERLAEAEAEINADRPLDSIALQEEALSDLIKLENYLRAMMPPGQQGSGSPSQSQGQQAQQNPQEGQQSMSMAEMRQLMDELTRLSEDQAAQNRRYERAERSTLSQQERTELQQLQDELAASASEQASDLQGMPGFSALRQQLSEASRNMQEAAGATGEGESRDATTAGARSSEALLNAMGLLDERIRQQATGALDALIAQAEGLAGRQSEAAGQSREAEGGAGGQGATRREMHQEQLGMNEDFEELMGELMRDAAEMSGQFPEAGEGMARAARDAGKARTEAGMQRAANALLYGRYGRAAELQDDTTAKLESLTDDLREARQQLPAMSASELQRLLDQVRQAQASGQQSGEGEPQPDGQRSGLGRLGGELERAGELLQNQTLSELGSELSAPTGSGASESGSGLTQSTLDNAARILQQYLRRIMVEDRIEYKRQSAPPPDKYRLLVEEYFKDLAEEP
ncbi:MAG: hypothetical protein AAGF10_00890 [Verrucomicrobiota bacterium]